MYKGAEKYFKHGSHLKRPEGAVSRESISAVKKLGHLKDEVRNATKFDLPNKDRKDSQGICFLGKVCGVSSSFTSYIFHGAGFGSKRKYMFRKVTIQLKLVEGDSAGTGPFLSQCIELFSSADNPICINELNITSLGIMEIPICLGGSIHPLAPLYIMKFLYRIGGDGPLVAFGASDGFIRVLSMMTWKAHDGGVVAVELSRVMGGAPQLITIGADKTLAIWDTVSFKVYCMVAHTLQPHLVAIGTNIGVIICEFDARSLPPVAPLPTPSDSREHSAIFVIERELKLLNFQLNNSANPSLGNNSSLSETGRPKGDFFEPLLVKQGKKHISTPVPHDSHLVLSVSSSGKYLAIVWPDIPYFSVFNVSDWSIVDSGSARLLAWDTCRDRFAILESALPPRIPIVPKGSSSKRAKEAVAAQAAAAAAAAASTASYTFFGFVTSGLF
ncbi:tRNA-specific 2-thiouridylase MnmA [Glycine soja]